MVAGIISESRPGSNRNGGRDDPGIRTMRPNPGQTEIRAVLLKNIDLQLADRDLKSGGVQDLAFDHVMINERQRGAPAAPV
ncbi:hypothetical protein [Novosphingobium lindaniclasticum]|uniref:Uncharacterized protein n=1 Tax=Novosphingobium lindaniclasticum LE124 TaxID=1096930 RepID=T0HAF2_9SPHN|nr:hypothetical protein [Novosphingobium lindaniclasticum]EQB09997.1 hypothetical protein L284_18065 [Novosphingobium lindaniclasticum LE124]